ncbi:MAG: glycoside hydrolase family 13 protein [Anaerolineales bacterium]|nr:glycoside hydrolase family 13 protein [Anaerolineales bacterium]
MTTPYWVQDSIFYQIFPDRFANGDKANDPVNVQPWGVKPTHLHYMGGDLQGITQKFNYLLDLGINAIYLNPIFHSTANHRYHTIDYFRIDPFLGSMNDFKALLNVAHNNNVRVILDGVFNHCGRGFFAFINVLENQEHSPYCDWFHIKNFPINAYGKGEAQDYLAWWGFRSLPKFNTDNQQTRKYLLDVARFWIDQGADGWRLDVPNEIDDDKFWAEFRDTVKSANPDSYLVGEIWTPDRRWVGETHFDGLMNYPFREAIIEFLTSDVLPVSEFANRIENLLNLYPKENVYAMYLPLGTHDTERLFSKMGNNLEKVKLAFLIQFAFPGAPAVYYGDEIGMQGGKDPESRGAFPWDDLESRTELHNWVKVLISLRKQLPVLRRGNYQRIFTDDRRHVFALARMLGDSSVLVAINASSTRRHVRFNVLDLNWGDGRIVRNLLGKEEYIVSEGRLAVSLPPWGGLWVA